MATIRGGKQLERTLASTVAKLTTAGAVRVGFLEGATYPTTERGSSALRKFRKGAKSPGAALSVATVAFWNNFGTSRAPARPFFTEMIAENSPRWGSDLAKVLVAAGYDSRLALGRMGVVINDQLVKKIVDWPADNAPRTVLIKGFNKGLIHRGVMQRSSAYEVTS